MSTKFTQKKQIELLTEWLTNQGKVRDQIDNWIKVYKRPELINSIHNASTRCVVRDKIQLFKKYIEQTHGVTVS